MALLQPRLCVLDETDSGPRHRRAEDRLRRRQPAALARPRHGRHHPLSAAARLHRAGRRARALEGPHREDRRRSLRSRLESGGYAHSRARLRSRHERRSPQNQDQCGAGAGPGLFGREGQAAGRPQGRGAARGRGRTLRRARFAAPAGRGVEIHRSPRAHRRGEAACRRAGRRRQGARQGGRQTHRRHGCAAHRVRRRHVRAGAFRPRRSVARPDHPLDGAGAGGGRRAGRRQTRQGHAGRRRGRGRAQHRADGRRRRHSRRQGRDASSGRSIWCLPRPARRRPRCSPARSS